MNVVDRIYNLSAVWRGASEVFPHFDRLTFSWDKAYRRYLDRILAASDDREVWLLLVEFCNLLGDGHTNVNFPKSLLDQNGYLPFRLRYLDGGYYLTSVETEYQHLIMAQVQNINSVDFGILLERIFQYTYHVDSYIPNWSLEKLLPFFLNKTNNEMVTSKGTLRFNLSKEQPEQAWLPAPLPRAVAQTVSTTQFPIRKYGNILYVRLNNFLDSGAANEIRCVLEGTKRLQGVILDLRENIGGMTEYASRVARLFIPGRFHGCQKWTRECQGVDFASASQFARKSQDRMERDISAGLYTREEAEQSMSIWNRCGFREYQDNFGEAGSTALTDKPVILLTSRNTASAAEDFVAVFRSNHRATILGEPTFGSTGTPLLMNLAGGGSFRICSVGYRLLDGTEFIGTGIQPDIRMPATAADWETGVDAVLEKALSLF